MLQITQINVYPVKSLDGYSPLAAKVEERGLQYDRRWMIVDEERIFFTQRAYPKMALLRAYIADNQLIIEEKNNTENYIKLGIDEMTEPKEVRVWNDRVLAALVSKKANEFLSSFLETTCYLVKMPETAQRRVEEAYNTGEDIVSFADGYPFLIIGESSINDLNQRLKTPLNAENQALVGLRRFRPNFVFKGGLPYEEETWTHFKIGNVAFQGLKPCGRCVMITLNPDTGEGGKEPLSTLASYHSQDKKVLFGQNLVWRKDLGNEGVEVKVGDRIEKS